MSMTPAQLERLDGIAEAVRGGDDAALLGISTGERIYVALASNRADLMPEDYTLVGALARLGREDVAELVMRWQGWWHR